MRPAPPSTANDTREPLEESISFVGGGVSVGAGELIVGGGGVSVVAGEDSVLIDGGGGEGSSASARNRLRVMSCFFYFAPVSRSGAVVGLFRRNKLWFSAVFGTLVWLARKFISQAQKKLASILHAASDFF